MSQAVRPPPATALAAERARYDHASGAAAAVVMAHYSSSFGLASQLLRQPVRDRVRNVYALVRLADEVVDGSLALERPRHAGTLLDQLETETLETLADGWSTNLVVHAFCSTARACGIGPELVTPFFGSMRTDLTVRAHDPESFARYVYGSAEVVGLMCLRVFLTDPLPARPTYDDLAPGARRLGAAFQKINFLRDLGADHRDLGRCYFPGVDPLRLGEDDKHRLLDDIDADLEAALVAVHGLPDSSRSAVTVAHAVFDELAARLRATPAPAIVDRRVRLSSGAKARVALAALVRERRP